MKTLNKIGNMLKITFEVFLVIAFIFLEELVWKKIAVPVAKWLGSLSILQKLQAKIELQTAYKTLAYFLILFGIVEIAGLYAGVLMVSGSFVWGVILYGMKVPIAAFAFWMFSFSKVKLLTIEWFATIYGLLMQLLDWITATSIYRRVKIQIYRIKKYIKNMKAGTVKDDLTHVYQGLTMIFRGKPQQ